MELYQIARSLSLPPQENHVPACALRVEFADGAFAEQSFAPSNTTALWVLIGASATLDEQLFFEVERADTGLKFQGYGDGQGFCLFQDTYQHEIRFLGSPVIDRERLDLVQIWDNRWPLTYFVPRAAFSSFEEMMTLGTQVIQAGQVGAGVTLSQNFPDLGLPDEFC